MKKNETTTWTIELATKAKDEYRETLKLLKNDNRSSANRAYKQANEHLLQAGALHLEMIKADEEVDLLQVHCEDVMAMANLYQSLVVYFSDLHEKAQKKKERSKWKK